MKSWQEFSPDNPFVYPNGMDKKLKYPDATPTAPPGLEMVSVDLIDDPFWVKPGEPGSQKMFRNVHVRMRLHEHVETTPAKVITLWDEFFQLWAKAKPNLNSDILLALSQKMFEIEEERKKVAKIPTILYGKGKTPLPYVEYQYTTGPAELKPSESEVDDAFAKAISDDIDAKVLSDLLATNATAHPVEIVQKPPDFNSQLLKSLLNISSYPAGAPLGSLKNYILQNVPYIPDEANSKDDYTVIQVKSIDGKTQYVQGKKKP